MNAYGSSGWLLAVALVIVAHAAPASAITAEEFRLRSGADIVALCSTPETDPMYSAAIHMCHGFGAGIYQTLTALTRHDKLAPILCPPEPPPTRNATVARFLEWATRNPQHLTEPAVDTVGRFFLATFPCGPK